RSGDDSASAATRQRVLDEWYRERLRELVPPLLARWESTLGVRSAEWRIRKMKTRWGSCSLKARRIWLNLKLAKKPEACLEFIVVHELLHLIERGHGARFRALLDRYLPDWRERRRMLRESR
ncbi:MAG: M48 family metallopeptidase, partial [Chloroflexi bacterium]|nr:M48 family metallopeptidase [Chloroflexota bacterium]